MKINYKILLFIICLLFIELFINSTFTDDDKQRHAFTNSYKIFSLPLPEKLFFANEPVLLNEMDVRERLDRELLTNVYWQSQTLLWLKRSHRWFPIIIPILQRNNIPEDFKYLPLIESGFQNLVSPAGAAGFWQLLDKTARMYGLEVTDDIDERYHVQKATEAACLYIKESYNKMNSWVNTAASYNMGLAGVLRQTKGQYQNNYYDLYLNTETSRYVFRILAAKLIEENPSMYGYEIAPAHYYRYIPTIKVRTDISIENLARYAINNHSNYKEIKMLNPWIRKPYFHPQAGKSYFIEFPKSAFTEAWLKQFATNDTCDIKNTIVSEDEKSSGDE